MKHMNQTLFAPASLAVILFSLLLGCNRSQAPANQEATPEQAVGEAAIAETGTLQVRANGEDLVRQGFVSKDGWDVQLDRVYVSLDNITAFQTDATLSTKTDADLESTVQVSFEGPYLVDLAAGDDTAEPILVDTTQASAGHYKGLSWHMSQAEDNVVAGQVLVLQGKARKAEQTIDFILNWDQEYKYTCGEFVGDERKGIIPTDGVGDLEITFHFDHIFGDGDLPPDDSVNAKALGFEPMAALAETNQLEVDRATLQAKLSPEDYELLEIAIQGLGHVGEGHCQSNLKE